MKPSDLHPDDPRTLQARLTVLEQHVASLLADRNGGVVPAAADQSIAERDRVGPFAAEVLAAWRERQRR